MQHASPNGNFPEQKSIRKNVFIKYVTKIFEQCMHFMHAIDVWIQYQQKMLENSLERMIEFTWMSGIVAIYVNPVCHRQNERTVWAFGRVYFFVFGEGDENWAACLFPAVIV